jgi:hypothetical protein
MDTMMMMIMDTTMTMTMTTITITVIINQLFHETKLEMKYLKILAIAIVCILTFGAAQAQVVVRAHVGPEHRYHHRYHHARYHHHHYNHYRR